MREYHKIETVFNRSTDGDKRKDRKSSCVNSIDIKTRFYGVRQ